MANKKNDRREYFKKYYREHQEYFKEYYADEERKKLRSLWFYIYWRKNKKKLKAYQKNYREKRRLMKEQEQVTKRI